MGHNLHGGIKVRLFHQQQSMHSRIVLNNRSLVMSDRHVQKQSLIRRLFCSPCCGISPDKATTTTSTETDNPIVYVDSQDILEDEEEWEEEDTFIVDPEDYYFTVIFMHFLWFGNDRPLYPFRPVPLHQCHRSLRCPPCEAGL